MKLQRYGIGLFPQPARLTDKQLREQPPQVIQEFNSKVPRIRRIASESGEYLLAKDVDSLLSDVEGLLALLRESQEDIGGDWRQRRDDALLRWNEQ